MWSFKDTGVWGNIMLEESDAFSREMVMCHEHHQLSLLQWTRPWDWFLNPVSMLHYNTDFMYFTTHLLQRTMGITLRTKVPTWIPVMDKVMLDLITTKAMSCHGKDVKLDCRGSNRADSFYHIIHHSYSDWQLDVFWTAISQFGNHVHKIGFTCGWIQMLRFFKPLWINSQIKESGFEQMRTSWSLKQILPWHLWFVSERSLFERTQAWCAPVDWGL